MIELNFLYADHQGPSQVAFENNIGKVYISSSYNENTPNISLNSYSAVKIKSNDSIFVAEPICVLADNYNIKFLNKFRYVFTWATKAFQNSEIANKIVYVNFPSYKGNPQINTNWPSWNDRADEIVFIANNKHANHFSELYSLRIKLADWLYANSKFKVSWYGNMPINRHYYRGKANSKNEILNKVKFHVCIENTYEPVYSANFLTEKLPDAWFAGTIPIYMGCSNMNEIGIPPDCYFDLTPFKNDFAKLEERLNIFSAEEYQKMTDDYSKLSDKLYSLTSYENMFDIMLRSYCAT